jgi:hypothetical protein
VINQQDQGRFFPSQIEFISFTAKAAAQESYVHLAVDMSAAFWPCPLACIASRTAGSSRQLLAFTRVTTKMRDTGSESISVIEH